LRFISPKIKNMWNPAELKDKYDVVIIGAGVHGLSTAYYLAKNGVTKVAVLDKGYVGGGASARSTAIIRANYLTIEGIPFFRESLKLYEDLSKELSFNILFNQMGRLDLGHSDSDIFNLNLRSEFNQALGVESNIIGPEEILEIEPKLDLRVGKPHPVIAALYHPPAGTARHDAVVWGYAREASKLGVEIFPFTEVNGFVLSGQNVKGVKTNKGQILADSIVSATAAWSSSVMSLMNITLPISTYPLQAMVTEPLKPILSATISSPKLHAYAYQTDRGEIVIGGPVDPYSTFSQKSTLFMLEELATFVLELLPCLRDVNVLRQWTGLCDMTPDYAPVMGFVEGVEGLVLNCGWGTWGFKAAPISGKTTAELIINNRVPELIKPFGLSRFEEGRLVNEKASATAAALH